MLTTRTVQQLTQLNNKRLLLFNEFKELETKENELLKQLNTIRNFQCKISKDLKLIREKEVWELIGKLG